MVLAMKNKIIICMGSSCHSRGNRENARIIKEFLELKKLNGEVEFTGSLCEERCSRGPVITVNGKTHVNVDKAQLIDILESELTI